MHTTNVQYNEKYFLVIFLCQLLFKHWRFIHQRTQDMLKMPTSLKLIHSLQKQHSKMHSWKYKKRISYAAEGHLLKY